MAVSADTSPLIDIVGIIYSESISSAVWYRCHQDPDIDGLLNLYVTDNYSEKV